MDGTNDQVGYTNMIDDVTNFTKTQNYSIEFTTHKIFGRTKVIKILGIHKNYLVAIRYNIKRIFTFYKTY